VKNSLYQYFVASLPAAVVGAWNLGDRLRSEADVAASIWQLELLDGLQIPLSTFPNSLVNLALGASFIVPLLVSVALASRFWAVVFSRTRRRPIDPGWFVSAWLFSLLVPATLPLHYAVIGYSFGAIFGCYVFGGSGRYIVNPALLGVAFLSISYPDLFAHDRYLPGSDTVSSWALVATEGIETAKSTGLSWVALFLGSEIGFLGTSSALASLDRPHRYRCWRAGRYSPDERTHQRDPLAVAPGAGQLRVRAGLHRDRSDNQAGHDNRLLDLWSPVRRPDSHLANGRSRSPRSQHTGAAARESLRTANRSHRQFHGDAREGTRGLQS
jgi:hypothetical protein